MKVKSQVFIIAMLLSTCFVYSQVKTSSESSLIPKDKNLSPEWIASLSHRGEPEIWSGEQLQYIGMPIGGIGCGQLYLAGDGRLWLWDIFKSNYSREDITGLRFDLMTMNGHYTEPVKSKGDVYSDRNGADVEQGFAISIKSKNKTELRTLDQDGFPELTFRGEYPMAKINYSDKEFPLSISLEAYSPFVPLEAENSALPATVFKFTINNTGKERIEATLSGWLQNATCPYDSLPALGSRTNTLKSHDGLYCVLSEVDASANEELKKHHGYGSMALSLMSIEPESVVANPDISLPLSSVESLPFESGKNVSKGLDEELMATLGQTLRLGPGEEKTLTFLVTWYFPLHQYSNDGAMSKITDFQQLSRHYKPWFADAADVAQKVYENQDDLLKNTSKWNDVWYDSSLPYWLLDRAMIPIDALATQTTHWFDNGRFWGWEGVESCAGTCTHVWNYAQGVARLFPQLERSVRQNADYGAGFDETKGIIGFRAENDMRSMMDGQAGTIMRTWREHTMSANDEFLQAVWPRTKLAIQWLMSNDTKQLGIFEGAQSNTLDATWFGAISWISSVYCGALRAGEQMAYEMDDNAFADSCRTIADNGYKNITERLFNGEYFINLPPNYNHINSNKGSHIDQVLGQSWAIQYNLPRVLPAKETASALNALWKYNFTPDAGGYAIKHTLIKGHRTYALEGEAGLMMTTWPYGGASLAVPGMDKKVENFETWIGTGGYFDETMTGFEYQVAAHSIYEGDSESDLVMQGLAIARAVHDRYAPEKRNPYNEIECGDHYARAMAAFGVYLAASGFEYHGPKGIIGFNPKINPSDFKAAFVASEGWGSFSQKREKNIQTHTITLEHGKLLLQQVNLQLPYNKEIDKLVVNGKVYDEEAYTLHNGRLEIKLDHLTINETESLELACFLD